LIPQIDYETGWPLPEVQQKLTELRLIWKKKGQKLFLKGQSVLNSLQN
jgi:hypothetical protein